MKNRYYVSPCDELNGGRTWDVMERAVREGHMRMDEATAVGNHETREQARKAARERNAASVPGKSTTVDISIGLALVREVDRLIEEKFEGDIYKQAFANVSGVPVDQVNAEQRQCVKLMSFGTRHGGSMKAALDSWKLQKGR